MVLSQEGYRKTALADMQQYRRRPHRPWRGAAGRAPEGPRTRTGLLLGYQSARHSTPPGALRAGRKALEDLAELEGLRLLAVFVEPDTPTPLSALRDLLQAVSRLGPVTVAAPTAWDLGRDGREQDLITRLIARNRGVRMLVITPPPG